MEQAGRGNMDQNANARGGNNNAKLCTSRVQLCGRRFVSTWTSQLLNSLERSGTDNRASVIISVTRIFLSGYNQFSLTRRGAGKTVLAVTPDIDRQNRVNEALSSLLQVEF